MRIAQRIGFDGALDRRERDALRIGRAVALRGQRQRALLHLLREHRRLGDIVDQPPVLGALAAHAFGGGAEDIGQVVAHMALVGHTGQAAGARQHAQQRHFRQAHRGGAVVHQQDFVAGQRQFIAAAGAGEVDLPRMAADAEHEDIGARAEHLVLAAGDDHGAHFGVFEADAVERIVQFDIDAKVVAVQLELVAGTQAGVLVDIHCQRGDRAFELQLQVLVLGGGGLVLDAGGGGHGGVSSVKLHHSA
ncbi:hypothetical protein D9M69_353230 [compost metagenome]